MTDEKNTAAQNVQPVEDKMTSGPSRTAEQQRKAPDERNDGSMDQDEGNMNHGETGNGTETNHQQRQTN